MSFSEECKIELWQEEPPKKPCCRRAMVLGMLFCADMAEGVFRFTVPAGDLGESIAAFLERELHCEVARTPFRHVGRCYLELMLYSRRTISLLQRADMSDLPLAKLFGFDCEHCLRYFLRGVFISAGSVTDLQKAYHMEFSCRDSVTAKHLCEVLGEIAARPSMIRRKNGVHLYYKSSAAMEDVFSYLNARRALFSLINTKIERDIRNEENRATNCVAKNIQKAVDAAAVQMAAIERLRESAAWDMLPRTLRETALLRLEYSDATLAELASRHNPPITKSGLNHRLQKLTALAEEAKQK